MLRHRRSTPPLPLTDQRTLGALPMSAAAAKCTTSPVRSLSRGGLDRKFSHCVPHNLHRYFSGGVVGRGSDDRAPRSNSGNQSSSIHRGHRRFFRDPLDLCIRARIPVRGASRSHQFCCTARDDRLRLLDFKGRNLRRADVHGGIPSLACNHGADRDDARRVKGNFAGFIRPRKIKRSREPHRDLRIDRIASRIFRRRAELHLFPDVRIESLGSDFDESGSH